MVKKPLVNSAQLRLELNRKEPSVLLIHVIKTQENSLLMTEHAINVGFIRLLTPKEHNVCTQNVMKIKSLLKMVSVKLVPNIREELSTLKVSDSQVFHNMNVSTVSATPTGILEEENIAFQMDNVKFVMIISDQQLMVEVALNQIVHQ